MVTLKPLDCNNFASEEAKIPFPSDEVTPPVTNMYLVSDNFLNFFDFKAQN